MLKYFDVVVGSVSITQLEQILVKDQKLPQNLFYYIIKNVSLIDITQTIKLEL